MITNLNNIMKYNGCPILAILRDFCTKRNALISVVSAKVSHFNIICHQSIVETLSCILISILSFVQTVAIHLLSE